MYSAYEKLTIFERRNIKRIRILFKSRKVELDVYGHSRTIIYENSSGNTTVTMGRIDDFQVDDNYLRVFCRDLELVLKNQTDCLESFVITSDDDLKEIGEKKLEYFFEAFKKSLESRNEPLRVKKPPYLKVLKTRDLMEQIAQTLECFDIQNLRRVSSGIRKCMDAVKPDPKIQKYRITVESDHHIKSEIFLRNGQRQFIEYSDDSRNLDQLTINRRSLIFDDFCDVALNDFYVNLRHQKTVLEELGVELSYKQAFFSPHPKPHDDYSDDEFPSEEKRIPIKHERSTSMDYPNLFEFVQNFVFDLKKILESMKNLRIRKLRIGSVDAREVERILKKCKNVESLEIFDPDGIHRRCSRMYNFPEELRNSKFDLGDILYLVYDFKELHIEIPIERDCDDEIPDVSEIGNLEIRIETISVGELSHFRTELLKSQTFEVFKIIFENMDSEDSLFANFGEPYHTIRNAKKIWYFRIPNTDFFMFIVLNPVIAGSEKLRIITFKKVRKERTPFL
ncbi:Protein CBG21727 [Caenorhabditis briggsae]|uniref:Protein CBG21727 n=1 Tax=Caenorhabditis briggsae TaxID=6238 RepID=A8Y0M3_CAEBR|nr:Protein CBG21727 [Caenorhabditis briggsae]CAP38442.2 Protein CBG21727 [Caenorhabditis briggsae]